MNKGASSTGQMAPPPYGEVAVPLNVKQERVSEMEEYLDLITQKADKLHTVLSNLNERLDRIEGSIRETFNTHP